MSAVAVKLHAASVVVLSVDVHVICISKLRVRYHADVSVSVSGASGLVRA